MNFQDLYGGVKKTCTNKTLINCPSIVIETISSKKHRFLKTDKWSHLLLTVLMRKGKD